MGLVGTYAFAVAILLTPMDKRMIINNSHAKLPAQPRTHGPPVPTVQHNLREGSLASVRVAPMGPWRYRGRLLAQRRRQVCKTGEDLA